MKWIFLTLLAANIVFAGYMVTQEPMELPDPDGAKRQYPDVPTIELLSETQGRSSRVREVEEVLSNPIKVNEVENVQTCQSLGPFNELTIAQDITERFNAQGLAVSLRAVDEPTGEYDYRVVIPPVVSLQEAFRRLRELKSQDIDSYVISQGEDALAISLGVFSSRSGADIHREYLTGEGYETEIREISRINRGYWVYAEEGVILPGDQIATRSAGDSPIGIRETACLN